MLQALSRFCFFILVASSPLSAQAQAHDYTIGALKIDHPWLRVPPPAAKVAGGFMKITNTGTTPDRLIGGTATIAGRIEVHEMSVVDGVMRMRELKPGLELAPGATVELKPGSYHVMFMDLKGTAEAGKAVKGTLVFEKAGKIDIEYKVEAAGKGGKGSGSGSGSGTGGHAKH